MSAAARQRSAPAGEAGAADAVVLQFLDPLPGLGELDRFTLTPIDETGQLFTLRAVADPEVRLFLLDPEPFFPTYRPALDDELLAALGLTGSAPTLLVVLTPATETTPHTANLLAPVVVNPRTAVAAQSVLDGADWPLRAPLVAAPA